MVSHSQCGCLFSFVYGCERKSTGNILVDVLWLSVWEFLWILTHNSRTGKPWWKLISAHLLTFQDLYISVDPHSQFKDRTIVAEVNFCGFTQTVGLSSNFLGIEYNSHAENPPLWCRVISVQSLTNRRWTLNLQIDNWETLVEIGFFLH